MRQLLGTALANCWAAMEQGAQHNCVAYDMEAPMSVPGNWLGLTVRKGLTDADLPSEVLEVLNGAPQVRSPRVMVWASDRCHAARCGLLRHEFQHVVQFRNDPRIHELATLAAHVASSCSDSGAVYQTIPTEIDANYEARRWVEQRHPEQNLDELADLPFAAATKPREAEWGAQFLEFFLCNIDACLQAFGSNTGDLDRAGAVASFARVLRRYSSDLESSWEQAAR